MSTIDPAVERAHRQESQRGSLLTLLELVVTAVGCLVTGYLAGRGLAGIIAVFLWMDSQGINEMSMSESPPYMWGLTVGVFGAVGASLWYHWTAHRFTDGRGLPLNGVTVAVAGAAYGVWVQGVRWIGPEDFWSDGLPRHASEEADYGAMRWADQWLPIICLVVTVAFLVASVWLYYRQGAKGEPDKSQPAMGAAQRTRGVVTEVTWTGVETNGRQLVQFTVKFTDQAGVQRWVTKKATFAPVAAPSVGMPAMVFYDPEHLDKTVVALKPLEVVERQMFDIPRLAAKKADPAPPWGSASDGYYRGDTGQGYYRGDVQDR